MIRDQINRLIIVLFVAAILAGMASIALSADPTPPPIPDDPDATPQPTAPPSGGSSGGTSYYAPPAATPAPTPTPTPTPVPPYRLDTQLPSKATVNNVPVKIEGTQVSVPMGYLFTDVIKDNTFEVPIVMAGGGNGKLVVAVEPSGSQTGTIKSMDLIAEKALDNNGQTIGAKVDLSLADLPPGSSVSFDLVPPGSVDINKVNDQMSSYGDRSFSTEPLLVFKATKNGLTNGKDILGAKFTFTVPRPASFDSNASYYVVRENDGAYDILNATLVSSPNADPLVFEVVSPRGLSTFSVVKAEASQTADMSLAATPTPAPQSASVVSGGLYSILALLGAFVVGTVAGIAVMWFRAR